MSLSQGTVTDVTIPGPGPFGFRLAGGRDFGVPLHISKITAGGKAQQSNLREKDVILMINGEDIATCTHLDAQNKVKAAFHDNLHLRTQRGDTRVWKPISQDDSGKFKVSLKANNDQEFLHPGSKTNFSPKGYGSPKQTTPIAAPPAPGRGTVPPPGKGSAQVVHLQFNSPAGLYSEQNIAETFKGQTEGMIDDSVGNSSYQPQPYQPMRDTGYSPKPGEVSATMIEPEKGEEIKYAGYINPGAQSRSFRLLKSMMDADDEKNAAQNETDAVVTETENVSKGGAVAHQAAPVNTGPVGMRSVKPPTRAPAAPSQQVQDLPSCAVCQSNIIQPSNTPSYSQPSQRSPQPYNSSPQAYSSPQSYGGPSSYAPTPPPPPPQPPSDSPDGDVVKIINPPDHHHHPDDDDDDNNNDDDDGQQAPSPAVASRPRAPQAVPYNQPSAPANRPKPSPQPKGGDQYCDGCRQIIKGTVVTALNRSWHPEHFVCAHCHDSLKNQGFVEHNNKIYCQTDYNKFYSPKCAACNQPVTGSCVTALGRQYHPEHFVCYQCKQPIGDQQFMVNNGQPYCKKDHEALFSHRCAFCNFTIDAGDSWVEAMDKCYHSNCFNCSICQTALEGQKFYAKNGRPVCQTHAY